jgi:hypothetical protein
MPKPTSPAIPASTETTDARAALATLFSREGHGRATQIRPQEAAQEQPLNRSAGADENLEQPVGDLDEQEAGNGARGPPRDARNSGDQMLVEGSGEQVPGVERMRAA